MLTVEVLLWMCHNGVQFTLGCTCTPHSKLVLKRPPKTEKEIIIYARKIYTAPCVMLLMLAASFTRASGRGLGPGN
jgi:hypothetical protein